MAIAYICDGCGASIVDKADIKEFGLVRKCQYCEKCAVHVEKYYAAVNAVHSELAAQWAAGVKKMQKIFAKELPKGRLPDGKHPD